MANLLRHTAAAAVLGVALFGGTGPMMTAAPAAAGAPTSAQVCAHEKQDVRAAQRALTKAKKAKAGKAVKVRAAKRTLQQERTQQDRACGLAERASSVSRTIATQTATYEALLDDPALDQLPLELRQALESLGTTARDELARLEGRVPRADARELSAVVTELRTLDPRTLDDAITELVEELRGILDTDDVALTLSLLFADATAGGALEESVQLDTIVQALDRVVALASGFDPDGGAGQVPELITAVDAVRDHLAESPDLLQGVHDLVTDTLDGVVTGPVDTLLDTLFGRLGLHG